jgi:cell wall-associated NlpC family hydrolase
MAKRIISNSGITPTATADTTNLVDSTYLAVLQGGSATQRINVMEVSAVGMAGGTTALPTPLVLARDTTVATGSVTQGTGSNEGPADAATAALAAPPLCGNAVATTKPQRSATQKLLWPALNALGGAYRWLAAPGEEISIVGNTQPLGELSLSCFTGGTPGLIVGHMVYEPF